MGPWIATATLQKQEAGMWKESGSRTGFILCEPEYLGSYSSVGLRKVSSGFPVVLWPTLLITLVRMGVYLREDFLFSFSHPCQ